MSDKTERVDQRIEVLSAILMAMVVVATAWSAYQSTLWGGIQTFKLREVTKNSNLFSMKTIQQGQYTGIDAIMFMEYINALHDNNQNLSEFYFERFRPELKAATLAWLETNPFENPDAPPHPFAMPEYNRIFAEEAEQFANESETKLEEAQQANQNSDNYVLLTVIYASVLFIGGIMSKFSSRKLRLILVLVGMVIFSVTTAVLFSMPIAME